ERVAVWIVFFEPGGAVLRFWAGHVQVAMCAEIPHCQLGEKLIGVGSRVRFLPKPFAQGTFVLFIEPGAPRRWNRVVAHVLGELVQANVSPMVAILLQPEQVL